MKAKEIGASSGVAPQSAGHVATKQIGVSEMEKIIDHRVWYPVVSDIHWGLGADSLWTGSLVFPRAIWPCASSGLVGRLQLLPGCGQVAGEMGRWARRLKLRGVHSLSRSWILASGC